MERDSPSLLLEKMRIKWNIQCEKSQWDSICTPKLNRTKRFKGKMPSVSEDVGQSELSHTYGGSSHWYSCFDNCLAYLLKQIRRIPWPNNYTMQFDK